MDSIAKKRFFKKSYRVTTLFDWKKFNSTFTANYIQHGDSLFTYIYFNKLSEIEQSTNKQIATFTIHDRFIIHPMFCRILNPLLANVYATFYLEMAYETHFSHIPRLLELQRKENDPDFFYIFLFF